MSIGFNQLTIDELINMIQSKLTFSGSIPCYLKNEEIERIILNDALPYFYNKYKHASMRSYFYLPAEELKNFKYNEAGQMYTILPDFIRQVVWVYGVNSASSFQLGISAPAISVNTGVSNQPYVSSFMSTIGELTLYRLSIQNFSDTLNIMTKHTYKRDFNPNTKVLTILTKADRNLILETFENIPAENLFTDTYFINYVSALAKIALGTLLSFYDMPLTGDVKINAEKILTQGETEKQKIEEEITKIGEASTFVRIVKR